MRDGTSTLCRVTLGDSTSADEELMLNHRSSLLTTLAAIGSQIGPNHDSPSTETL